MKVLTVVGARPQFIKAAPVSAVLRAGHTEVLLHTGQHYDVEMSELFFRTLNIPAPDYNLEVGSGSHGAQTARMLEGIEAVAIEVRPDWVLVYGDTNSTLAGALAAAKLHIPIAHVEAGLRSFDRSMPEEVNRVLTDHISELLFCPTESAVRNLAREGISDGVKLVGDVMYDAFLQHHEVALKTSDVLSKHLLGAGAFHLLTVHRADNVDNPTRLQSILDGVIGSGCQTVFPVHPRTREVLTRIGFQAPASLILIDPIGYLDMLVLESNAAAIVTDSGGVQKEAYLCGRPCITLRDRTEWTETVKAGWNTLVGTDPQAIAAAMRGFRPSANRPLLFGDGRAAELVVAALSASG